MGNSIPGRVHLRRRMGGHGAVTALTRASGHHCESRQCKESN